MRAYPLSKRIAVLKACDSGQGTRQVAKEHGCSESWVRRLKQQRRMGTLWRPRLLRRHPRRKPRWIVHEDQIDELMRNSPQMTLRELKAALDTDLSLPTLSRALKHLNWSKNRPRGWRDEIDDDY